MQELIARLSPYPHNDSDGRSDGVRLKQPSPCQKCTLTCATFLPPETGQDGLQYGECTRDLSIVRLRRGPLSIQLHGVIVVDKNVSCPKALRKRLKTHHVTTEEILAWFESWPLLQQRLDERVAAKVQEALQSLHDINTGVNLVTRNMEALVRHHADETHVDHDALPDNLRALVSSVQLLHKRMELSSIINNPDAATYGNKRVHPVYRAVHRLVKIFEETARSKNVRLRMEGQSFGDAMVYDSFELLPTILIDNAIKYTLGGREVVVRVEDVRADEREENLLPGIYVEVASYGPVVPPNLRTQIFNRGTRAQNAARFAAGSGLGLYTARLIADAHGTEINYEVEYQDTAGNGQNIFHFEVDALPPPAW